MKENIAAIQDFLKRGEMRLCRENDIYQILEIDEQGKAHVLVNPHLFGRVPGNITLTEKEIAELASLCFPKKYSPVEIEGDYWCEICQYAVTKDHEHEHELFHSEDLTNG